MTENTKSLIRHVLTVLGTIVGLVGLNDFVPVLDFLTSSLDGIWDAVTVVVGFGTTLFGYFKDSKRHEEREAGAAITA